MSIVNIRDPNARMALRIVCKDKEIVLENIVEYVFARTYLFAYVHRPDQKNDVEVIERSRIKRVFRIEDENREWQINIPQRY